MYDVVEQMCSSPGALFLDLALYVCVSEFFCSDMRA